MDDQNFSVAPGRDTSRQDATDNDTDFSLSLEEVAERYERAGHPRTLRSLQRYCASGHLDARKIATTMGDKYLVTPQSVARHIAQIVEFSQLDAVATGRDMSRPVATITAPEESLAATTPENGSHTEPDRARQAATDTVAESHVHPQEPRHEAATAHDTHATGGDRDRTSGHGSSCSSAGAATRSIDSPRQVATGRDRTQPRQGRRRAMSRSLSTNLKLRATNATSCASRSIAKTAPSKRSSSAIARRTFSCAAFKRC